MEEFLGKKYIMTHQENFHEFLTYVGLGYIPRKIALSVSPVQCLTRNEDGTYLWNIKAPIFNWDIVFTPGVEFDEKKPYGKTIRAIITLEGNVMTHVQYHEEGKRSKHIIEFFPDKNVVTTIAEGLDIKILRHYELVE